VASNFVAGIDPGKTGGWAIVDIAGRRLVAGGPLNFEAYDLQLFDALNAWGVEDALIERAQAASGDAGQFEYGRSFGRTESAIVLASCNIWYVAPSWWKGKLGCPVDKKGAYALAERIFPNLSLFANNGPRGGLDTGTAEGALIAHVMARPSLRAEVEKNNAARIKSKRRKKVRFEL
jgi:hypothetical protein